MKHFTIYAHLCQRMTVYAPNEETARALMLSDEILNRLATLRDNDCPVWFGQLADLAVRRAHPEEAEKWQRGFRAAQEAGAMPGDSFAVALDEIPDVPHPYIRDALCDAIEAE